MHRHGNTPEPARRRGPSAYWLDPEEHDLDTAPAPLDLGATKTLVTGLARKLHRLRRRSALHTRGDVVDAAIAIIETELPRLAAELAAPPDEIDDDYPDGAA
jgi:hypothetical protein